MVSTEITNWGTNSNYRDFFEQVVEQINRDPNRRARVEPHKTRPWCRVVDDSSPIKAEVYTAVDGGYHIIVGWEPPG